MMRNSITDFPEIYNCVVKEKNNPLEAHPLEAPPLEAHPLEAHPLEAHPLEAHPLEAHPLVFVVSLKTN